jgi:hypothetical protein
MYMVPSLRNLLALSLLLGLWSCRQASPDIPAPTGGETIVKMDAEEGGKRKFREAWFEAMHRAAPGTDWRSIEYRNRQDLLQWRKDHAMVRGDGLEVLADGKLTGRWLERGSNNQAGSVITTEFDPVKEEIWLISDGGTLYRGKLSGNNWTVVNQDLPFDGYLLRFIPGPNGRRLLTIIRKVVHYSDDDGMTWTAATGMSTFDNNWGGRKDALVLDDTDHTIFYLVQQWLPGPWMADVGIYMSKDGGETFTRPWSFGNGSLGDFSLCRLEGSDEVLIFQKNGVGATRVWTLDTQTGIPTAGPWNNTFGVGGIDAYLTARKVGDAIRLFTYNSANQLFRSNDLGANWTPLGEIDERPWRVGIHVSEANPNFIMVGGVHCHRSVDGGQTFTRFNNWWDYYANVNHRLHADMMYFKEFRRSNGQPFWLISNHGGLNVTYDGASVINLGLKTLNVSQYYDVVTDPVDEWYIYAGSQDQGFQRTPDTGEDDILDFEQAISGDYGHMVFTGNGQKLWAVYPGGWVTFWPNPRYSGYSATWELESEHESVWIPPLVAHPNPALDVVFMAGGNMHGGPGSHIIRLEHKNGAIEATQLPFDFRAFSGGEVSAMAFSPHDPDRMYAATTNGYFFYSQDQGLNWDVAVGKVPGGQYLYGAVIRPCPVNPQRVYFGGSGYSNPAVLVSENGGATFAAMNQGLPPTLVLDMAIAPDGQMIFAGTETGPFVWLASESQWFPMMGATAPLQRYWSVEYLPQQHRVRFGTYGRGIWDFAIDDIVALKRPEPPGQHVAQAGIFPNPVRNGHCQVHLPGSDGGMTEWSLHDLSGNPVHRRGEWLTGIGPAVFPIPSGLSAGNYLLSARQGGRQWQGRLIIMP